MITKWLSSMKEAARHRRARHLVATIRNADSALAFRAAEQLRELWDDSEIRETIDSLLPDCIQTIDAFSCVDGKRMDAAEEIGVPAIMPLICRIDGTPESEYESRKTAFHTLTRIVEKQAGHVCNEILQRVARLNDIKHTWHETVGLGYPEM